MRIGNYKFIELSDSSSGGKLITRKVRVVQEGYTIFFNCQHLFIQLGSDARAFFDFLCEGMRTDNNGVMINKELKNRFIAHISKITGGKVVPADNSLNRYVSVFKSLGLIILDMDSERGFYYVNPKYVFKGSKKQRMKILRELIVERVNKGRSLKGLVDSAADNFR